MTDRSRRAHLLDRRMAKLLREPPSIRVAASVVVSATALVVVGSGVLMRIVDHREYSSVWVAMWWALQTVTTVGYGDVTPRAVSGRVIGVFVMLQGIAFLTITTAVITSTFVARAERQRADADAAEGERLDASLDDLGARLARIESLLRERGGT